MVLVEYLFSLRGSLLDFDSLSMLHTNQLCPWEAAMGWHHLSSQHPRSEMLANSVRARLRRREIKLPMQLSLHMIRTHEPVAAMLFRKEALRHAFVSSVFSTLVHVISCSRAASGLRRAVRQQPHLPQRQPMVYPPPGSLRRDHRQSAG